LAEVVMFHSVLGLRPVRLEPDGHPESGDVVTAARGGEAVVIRVRMERSPRSTISS